MENETSRQPVGSMSSFIASIDQGTTSTRCMIFDHEGPVACARRNTAKSSRGPAGSSTIRWKSGNDTQEVIAEAISLARAKPGEIVAVGIANQRETTVVWDRHTGKPLANAIVWQDTRTKPICDELAEIGGIDRFRAQTGLPLATYFSGPKLHWILENNPEIRHAARRGDALFGTIDSWLIWNLTGDST